MPADDGFGVTIVRTFRHDGHHRRSAIWQEPVSVGEARARVLRPQSSELLAERDVDDDEVRARSAYDDEGDDQDGIEHKGEVGIGTQNCVADEGNGARSQAAGNLDDLLMRR
jgi:hypothetical protein